MGAVLEFTSEATATKPATCFFGSGSASGSRTLERSGSEIGSSSPAIDTSMIALRIPRLEEKSRYTVAGGTSEWALMASIVVLP